MLTELITKLELSERESNVFIDLICSEVKCLVNEWDDQTMRMPSKKRMAKKELIFGIQDKWEKAQPSVTKTHNRISILPPASACTLFLTKKEMTYCRALFTQKLKRIKKYLEQCERPYTGAAKEINEYVLCTESLINRM